MNAFKSEKSENVMLRQKFDAMRKQHDFEIGNLREMFNNVVSGLISADRTLRSEIDKIKNETIENALRREQSEKIMLQTKFDHMRKEHNFEIGNLREMLNNVVYGLNSTDRTLRSEIDTIKHDTLGNLSATKKLVHDSYVACQKDINHTSSYFNDWLMRVNNTLDNLSLNALHETARITLDIANLKTSNEIMKNSSGLFPISCDTVAKSGDYKIYPSSHPNGIRVYCYKDSTNKGWIVIQRRADLSVNFNRTWADYKAGFGNLSGEFWLGNEHIYTLTKDKQRELRIDINTWNGKQYALYSNFSISSESEKYRLRLSGYSGDAGDGVGEHNGQSFSTFDADNDNMMQKCCACNFGGGWWYHSNYCSFTNLNGNRFGRAGRADGFEWWEGSGGNFLMSSSMSIR
ncbi:techylectin-5B-like [Dreissena polymorpha]|nr:techylectin-5B-like [Dreissena polymorpha]